MVPSHRGAPSDLKVLPPTPRGHCVSSWLPPDQTCNGVPTVCQGRWKLQVEHFRGIGQRHRAAIELSISGSAREFLSPLGHTLHEREHPSKEEETGKSRALCDDIPALIGQGWHNMQR
jgi:hypothetical protein